MKTILQRNIFCFKAITLLKILLKQAHKNTQFASAKVSEIANHRGEFRRLAHQHLFPMYQLKI